MAKMTVDIQLKELPTLKAGTLMIHKDMPPMIVMATGVVVGDEFPGVSIEDGIYGEQWISTGFNVFDGSLTLQN